jgi:DNA-binding response OmpR family regulator
VTAQRWPMARVLVVEDEGRMATLLRRGLGEEGYAVDVAVTGPEALSRATEHPYDAIVLDVMLPGASDVEVCRELRRRERWTPVVMVTARDAIWDRIAGLDSGADDYVVKPFGRQELVARVQALLRRAARGTGQEEQETYADSYVAVDWAQRRVTVGEREVQLTPLEFRLLSTFVRNPRQVLSRDQLLELVWGDTFGVGGDQVKLYIGYLRRKLDPDAPDSVPIETVRGFGYRWKAAAT